MKINCLKCGNEMKLEQELPGMMMFTCDKCKRAKLIDSSLFRQGIEKKIETGHIVRRGA